MFLHAESSSTGLEMSVSHLNSIIVNLREEPNSTKKKRRSQGTSNLTAKFKDWLDSHVMLNKLKIVSYAY